MPKIDMDAYNNASASASSTEFKRIGAGAYVVRITDVVTTDDRTGADLAADRQYVWFLFDVAEGEFAGEFSRDFYADKPYRHRICMSWKNLGALKGNITAIEESNKGFDAMAALEADAWGLFVGREVGIVWGEETYYGNDGSVKTRFKLPNLRSAQAVRDGKCKVPDLDTSATNGEMPSTGKLDSPADDFSDIPF